MQNSVYLKYIYFLMATTYRKGLDAIIGELKDRTDLYFDKFVLGLLLDRDPQLWRLFIALAQIQYYDVKILSNILSKIEIEHKKNKNKTINQNINFIVLREINNSSKTQKNFKIFNEIFKIFLSVEVDEIYNWVMKNRDQCFNYVKNRIPKI